MKRRATGLILGGLAALGPFSIDTYFPSFPALAAHFGVSEIQVQSTLSFYLAALTGMNLFHGALSDSFGTSAGNSWVTGPLYADGIGMCSRAELQLLAGLAGYPGSGWRGGDDCEPGADPRLLRRGASAQVHGGGDDG